MLKRKLLTILFICILLPVLVILFQSSSTIIAQKKMTTEMSGRYVQNLARYAADRWDEGNADRVAAFLSLMTDEGYDMLISIGGIDTARIATLPRQRVSMKGKFVPGMVAYVTADGRLLSNSQNASILVNIFEKVVLETRGGVIGSAGHIVGSFRSGAENISYVAYISPTADPRVYAVAAVTMLSWMGKNDFDIIKLAVAGILGMLICLVALMLMRGSVIVPLQELSAQVNTLKWGQALPPTPTSHISNLHVEEIASLNKAVHGLAERMIEKDELEKRYVGDIIKAQEDERGRIAQDIHDGPIQVVSALIQRIQMANMSPDELPEEARRQLSTAEDAAQDLVEDLRDICDSLVPPWVSLGLVSCMEETANRYERQHDITINTNIDQSADATQETTLALFRIFQEAVSNAVRHGHASEVDLSIERIRRASDDETPHSLRMTILDNGTGFDPHSEMTDDLVRLGKRGLKGMKQRIDLLGGTYAIDSKPGEGTRITIVV